ncbi:MAG TPA: ATP-dependent helicase C-terminal domain-containing protein [Bryobacteraceae bacterium]|nr:ATP-dependent helicase C-terminal domain-containing protein [Bryobacteraceae bacterium]
MKLPIDEMLPQVVETLRREKYLVIEAPPGAGKTTRIPPALLPVARGEIVVLEPRRLAARMAARRVASELGERLGETVGYQVRFEDISGPRTRLRFVTEGVLTRRLMSDPKLRGVDIVILDEFHERHLDSDLALALLRRTNVRIVVMSATLNAAPIAKYLADCPVLRSEGKLHDLSIEYTPHSSAPLEEQVRVAVERLGQLDGDVLVFLPGAAEIRRAARALEKSSALVVPLHGDLSPEEQDRAVAPAGRPKIILSTNVAESSVTIEGVTAVIDSGLARVAADSPWTGLPALDVKRISKASATQRAGRAGRTAPGRVIRLYTAEEFHRRQAADAPEISRRELSQVVLQLRAMKIDKLDFLDAPPEAAWTAANQLLDTLEATPEMAALPLPPRLAKLVTEAARRGAPEKGCAVAAVLSAGERGPSDLLALAESDWQPQTRRVYDQLRRLVPGRDRTRDDAAVLQAVLAAFPDRVARRRLSSSRDGELLLSQGGSARLPDCRHEFLVAVDIEERRDKGLPLVRLAAAIEPEWLLDRAVSRTALDWNRAAERVEQVSALVYDRLVIEETRAPAAASEEASNLLAARALDVDFGRFVDREALEQLLARADFAGISIDVAKTLTELCQGRTAFAEITDLLPALRPARIDQLAPERLKLPRGREVKVHYETGKPPWIESRLQDFFGVRETPRIGSTPVVVHLLAPNRRPVQVTSDLHGFWERLYPQVRRELSRRYPKHKWPENPG